MYICEQEGCNARILMNEDGRMVSDGRSMCHIHANEYEQQFPSEATKLRTAIMQMIASCRLDCNAESYCGVCAIGLKALEHKKDY